MAQASGWLGRALRLLERHGPDEVERGYLLLPSIFEHEARGELEAAARVAGEAVAIAERFGDRDLFALAAHMQGHILVEHGRLKDGMVRHPRLSARPRGAARARVDRGALELVRAPARPGCLHRALPDPPGRDPAALAKLGVASRAAATACAHEHRLV